jgi:glycosyltransferase involved in cell wall biosynthesis
LLNGVALVYLTVVVPTFNEEENIVCSIPPMIDTLSQLAESFEIILVNDGSKDTTGEKIENLCGAHEMVRSVHHEVNRGFGGAIKSGFDVAEGQYVMYYPADSVLKLTEIQNYLALIKNSDIVVGYRRGRPDYTLFRKINSTVYYLLVNFLLGLRLSDVNWIHIYKREVIQSIKAESNHIFFCAEMLIKAMDKGYIITGVDVTYIPRKFGKETGSSLKTVFKTFSELMKFWFKQLLSKDQGS